MTKAEAYENYMAAIERASALHPDGWCELTELEEAYYILMNYEDIVRKNKEKQTPRRRICPAGRPLF